MGLGCIVRRDSRTVAVDKKGIDQIDQLAVLYSLYAYGEVKEMYGLTLEDLYHESKLGPYKLYGIPRESLKQILRGLSSSLPQFISVDLVRDLDNIHLRREKREGIKVPNVYAFGEVEIDFAHFKIRRRGKERDITSLECEILKYFIAHKGEVVTRDMLLDKIWGYEKFPTTRTIDNHILKLRKKIELNPSHPEYILSVYGEGYRFMG